MTAGTVSGHCTGSFGKRNGVIVDFGCNKEVFDPRYLDKIESFELHKGSWNT